VLKIKGIHKKQMCIFREFLKNSTAVLEKIKAKFSHARKFRNNQLWLTHAMTISVAKQSAPEWNRTRDSATY